MTVARHIRLRHAAALVAVAVLAVLAIGHTARAADRPLPAFEYTRPTRDRPPRGYVMVLHASGWHLVGQGMLGLEHPNVARLSRWGYGVLNIDYGEGRAGLADTIRFYDTLRSVVGRDARICAFGVSSGGHWALMLARRRPSLACVVTEAAPTDLARLPQPLLDLAEKYFFNSYGGLARWSPALHPLTTPLLLSHARNDDYVPFERAVEMRQQDPEARLFALRAGNVPWVHASVAACDLRRLHRTQRKFLRRHTAAG